MVLDTMVTGLMVMADVLSRDGPPFCVHNSVISTSVSIASLVLIVAVQSISIYVPVSSTTSLGYVATDTVGAGTIKIYHVDDWIIVYMQLTSNIYSNKLGIHVCNFNTIVDVYS